MENPADFTPATYTMITGEKALSPDKVFDLKNLTDEDNKNGEKIKIVIISMTGSEGIDFKNLRQVHILEPWYNLSLIEQIIGRAVRTCSHKQLPFKDRNVEIFLYGTIMTDTEEEAADLYIYRLAELKAVQIGRVSRILKESSVDCILNIDQTNFTEENMNTIVKQQLSNKKVIDFPIGDKANTVSCDYMDTCNFKCKPFKKIAETDIKLDTYDESFIIINTDKIIQRIRDLFKEKFFYKKDKLISEINVVKNYPIIQINAALTVLIDDQNEYLTDKYDRLGHLVNIEEYYLFQPIELNNENISVFDRRNPIDYKHKEIVVPIQMKKEEPLISMTKDKLELKKNNTEPIKNTGIKIIEECREKYNTATSNIEKIKRGEDDWYHFVAVLKNTNAFKKNMEMSDADYRQFIVSHILDYLVFEDTKEVLTYIYFKQDKLTDFEQKIKKYYDDLMMEHKGIIGIILPKDNKQHLLVKGDEEWKSGQQEDYTDLVPELRKLVIPLTDYNTLVGFITMFKKDYNIFKVKNMEDKRSKGARCDQAGKSETIKLLNEIMDDSVYSSENTKGRNKIEFCVMQEMYLRYFDKTSKNNKRWFVTPSEMILNGLEKLSFQ